jgi:hypothetical protein
LKAKCWPEELKWNGINAIKKLVGNVPVDYSFGFATRLQELKNLRSWGIRLRLRQGWKAVSNGMRAISI